MQISVFLAILGQFLLQLAQLNRVYLARWFSLLPQTKVQRSLRPASKKPVTMKATPYGLCSRHIKSRYPVWFKVLFLVPFQFALLDIAGWPFPNRRKAAMRTGGQFLSGMKCPKKCESSPIQIYADSQSSNP